MFPNLISIGPITIHTYGLLVALGFVAALTVTVWIGKQQGIQSQQVMDMAFAMAATGLVGSRLLYVAMQWEYFSDHPLEIPMIWRGGLVFHGAVLGAVVALFWYTRRHGISFWEAGDLWAPGTALGQAIGRIGCFMAGCCYGKPADHPFAVVFTHPESLAPLNVPLHPTQLYSSALGAVIFVALMVVHKKKKYAGQVVLWFLVLHSFARLFVERFRGDDRGLIAGTGMTPTQLTAVLVLVASGVILVIKSFRHK